MNISAVDLNLFLVLHTVLEEGSATRAAKKLHVTQSAVSNSLARLRELLGDPLVVRSGRGVAPTPRAVELAPHIARAIDELRAAVGRPETFDPLTTRREFTIASTDAESIVDLPRVVAALSKCMPRATLRAVTVDYLMSTDGLASGTVDLVLGYAKGMDASWHTHPLYVERPALVVRRDHPAVGSRITRKQFESLLHIDVHVQLGTPGAGNREAKKALTRKQLHREVRLVVPSFTAAALAAVHTDYVAGLPRRLAEVFCTYLPLRLVEMSGFDLRFPAVVAWHPRTDKDPAVGALRQLVIETLSDQVAPRPKGRGNRGARTSSTPGRRGVKRRASTDRA